MRKPLYLSPSAVKVFYDERQGGPAEYFRRYLASTRAPRFPQTQPMAAGSAFDAYCKSHLHNALFGSGHKESSKYTLKALFESQVEPAMRDWARPVGEYIFKEYQESGALADLMIELNGAIDEPRFEFDLMGEVKGSREGVTKGVMGVTLMGKPDLRFINAEGAHVIYDWKVNGFCGRSNTSPKPGYVQLRDGTAGFWSRKGAHKDAFVQRYRGMDINTGHYLESIDEDWALQLSTYGWLLGEQVGSEIITGIDQIACNGAKCSVVTGYPPLRIASHRMRVSENFQIGAFEKYAYLWAILSDIGTDKFYFFRDISFEESKLKCESLEREVEALVDPEVPSEIRWGYEIARGH